MGWINNVEIENDNQLSNLFSFFSAILLKIYSRINAHPLGLPVYGWLADENLQNLTLMIITLGFICLYILSLYYSWQALWININGLD